MIGVGLDLVDIERFREVLARRPSLHQRLFTDGELAWLPPAGIRCRPWPCGSRRRRR